MDLSWQPNTTIWAEQQWGSIPVDDPRLRHRAVTLGAQLAQQPQLSFPQQLYEPALLKSWYRFLANEQLSHEILSTPHWQQTRIAATTPTTTLMIADQSELDFTRYRHTMADLGPIGQGPGRGLFLHTTLAVRPTTRQVVGIAQQQVFRRTAIPKGTKRHHRPKAERESRIWSAALTAMG